MKFPYGICDFREIVTQDYLYCDRTDRIPLLEKGKYLLFIRPRRFGKSLLLSMLSNYYDVAKAPEFETLFGHLSIGKNPTTLQNRYFILHWDFSCVDPSGDASKLPKGGQLLLNLVREDRRTTIAELADRFGIREMLSAESKDRAFMVSFLYYFGVLTIRGLTETGEIAMTVPNLVMRKLYIERLQKMLLPAPSDRDDGASAAKKLYQEGDIRPLCEFVEKRYFKVFHNKDYRWANELTVKTAFLTLLYNDILYIMDSETEVDRRYADLTMIIRPDMRRFTIFDILIEFKFVTLKEAGLSGEAARKLKRTDLKALSSMVAKMDDAKAQVAKYGRVLEKRHGDLRLRKYAVVSLGFERIWGEEARGEDSIGKGSLSMWDDILDCRWGGEYTALDIFRGGEIRE